MTSFDCENYLRQVLESEAVGWIRCWQGKYDTRENTKNMQEIPVMMRNMTL